MTPEELAQLVEALERLAEDPALLAPIDPEVLERLMRAAGRLSRPDKLDRRKLARARRKLRAQQRREADRALLDRTGIRRQQKAPLFPTPDPAHAGGSLALPRETSRVDRARCCYTCKRDYHELHPFYDALCPDCGALNWDKRQQTADLVGRTALLTGARVKIGYQVGIKLLRAGAYVIATTRFPQDAARRYAEEPDFADWADRLEIHGLDLRVTPAVEAFCAQLRERFDRLDYLVNNACQTVRRPTGWYAHLLPGERAESPPEHGRLLAHDERREAHAAHLERMRESTHDAPALSQVPLLDADGVVDLALFPAGELDADEQQVDRRDHNSWRMTLAEVSSVELLEVMLINSVAPFVLAARLKPLMCVPTRDAHVVNVSAMEGQFYRMIKTDKHPHTNMAKAALNMLTRTSAADYIKDGIHINSVDTGWITDEDPLHVTLRKQEEHGFHPPLDHVDAAARILDPILVGVTSGVHVWGLFLKDYAPAPW